MTPDAYHHLLTVYAAGVHDADHREVFDMERETV